MEKKRYVDTQGRIKPEQAIFIGSVNAGTPGFPGVREILVMSVQLCKYIAGGYQDELRD